MKKTALTLIALALAFTTACGGGDSNSDRPSRSEISKSLAGTTALLPEPLDKKQADCVAKLLEESKLSDKALTALVEQDTKYKGTKKDVETLGALGTKMQSDCPSPKK